MGGKATAKKHGKKYMQELGRKGAKKRWENYEKDTKRRRSKKGVPGKVQN